MNRTKSNVWKSAKNGNEDKWKREAIGSVMTDGEKTTIEGKNEWSWEKQAV